MGKLLRLGEHCPHLPPFIYDDPVTNKSVNWRLLIILFFNTKQVVAQSTVNYNNSEHNNKYNTVKDIIYTTFNHYKKVGSILAIHIINWLVIAVCNCTTEIQVTKN